MPMIAVINGGNTGSTGKIIYGIYELGTLKDFHFKVFTPQGNREAKNLPDNIFIGSKIERRISEKINYFTGFLDSLNWYNTTWLIKKLKLLQPDLIHLHNIHGNYINISLLFKYLKESKIPVVWTLHDCWSFTGQCSHFTIIDCQKWKLQCHDCPNIHNYPASHLDYTNNLYLKKKALFTGLNNLSIGTPSKWLADKVACSFMKDYPIHVIPNGVDLDIFKPVNSDFRERFQLENQFLIVAVAPLWTTSKGIDRLLAIAESLDNRFSLVIVGTLNKKISNDRILCVSRTNNQIELAEIYSTADAFINPTREDTFPTVNLEALACGTPVISFGACGSSEAYDEVSGVTVNEDTIMETLDSLYQKNFSKKDCITRSKEFEKSKCYQKYIELYRNILEM